MANPTHLLHLNGWETTSDANECKLHRCSEMVNEMDTIDSIQIVCKRLRAYNHMNYISGSNLTIVSKAKVHGIVLSML